MANLSDLARKGALLALVSLYRTGRLDATGFEAASETEDMTAKRLRESMADWGLISVREEPARGFKRIVIELTPFGARVAAKLAEVDGMLSNPGLAQGSAADERALDIISEVADLAAEDRQLAEEKRQRAERR